MSEIKFADNYSDLSREGGVDSGFQFEFYCERCHDTWRTPFVPYRSGQASGWLQKVSGFLGGLGVLDDAVHGLAESGWHNARDVAFKNAVEQAKQHFHRCSRCFQYMCDRCWNVGSGLCKNCAPDAQAEIEAAKAYGMAQGAGEMALEEGVERGRKMDVKTNRQMTCPACGEATAGAKFCPSCGHKLAVESHCPDCGATVSPSARFCVECGTKIG